MKDVIKLIEENWDMILEGGALLLAVVSFIVGATKTQEDDNVLKKVLQWLSFLQPSNAPGTLSVPFRRTNSVDSEPSETSTPPPTALLVFLGLAGAFLPSCAGIQTGLNTGSELLRGLSPDVAEYYGFRDLECREEFPPLPASVDPSLRAERRGEYDQCMLPVEVIRSSRVSLDSLLRAAQRAYDASGEEGFREMVPCLLEVAQELLGGIMRITDEVPRELLDLIDFLSSYLAEGEECNGHS